MSIHLILIYGRKLLLLLTVLVLPGDGSWAQVPQVYLIQNSGWMEPYYVDPKSDFRSIVRAFIDATADADGDIVIASFNQHGQLPDQASPHVVYRGSLAADAVEQALAAIDLPRRPNGKLTDADFYGALFNTIKQITQRQSAIIWMVTNNKDSPNNSQEVMANTRRFYQLLRSDPAIAKLVSFPIRHAVTGRYYTERGFIIYGIAYGQEADARLQQVLEGARVHGPFEDPAVRLKPLTTSALTFTPERMVVDGKQHAVPTGPWLVLSNIPSGEATTITLQGRLASAYYPQVIDQANVFVEWLSLQGFSDPSQIEASIKPSIIERLRPGEILEDVVMTLMIPPIERPPGLSALLSDSRTVDGTLRIGLQNARLVFLEKFQEKMSTLFGLDQLPEIFFDYRGVATATTDIPVKLKVEFSALPLILALAGAATLVASCLGIAILLARERRYIVSVGPERKAVSVRPFDRRQVVSSDRKYRVEVVGRLFSEPQVRPLDGKGKAS